MLYWWYIKYPQLKYSRNSWDWCFRIMCWVFKRRTQPIVYGAMTVSHLPVPLHVTHFLMNMTVGTALQVFEYSLFFRPGVSRLWSRWWATLMSLHLEHSPTSFTPAATSTWGVKFFSGGGQKMLQMWYTTAAYHLQNSTSIGLPQIALSL